VKSNNLINKEKTLVVITGTTKGLGKSLKKVFQNFNILEINRTHETKNGITLDLSSREIDIKKFCDLINKCNKIIFISNASTIDPISNIDCINEKDIEESIYTNYINPSKIILNILKSQKQFVIINITSGAAFMTNTKLALYSASKASMHRFIEILKEEEKNNPKALYVDNFDPGRMQTEMQSNLIESKQLDNNFGALNKPEKIADDIYKLTGRYI